ncbi:MAG: hydrocarbon-binding protein [Myxococcota bacterium]
MADLREDLGDMSSIVCFKSIVIGAEESIGKAAATVALTAAGRKRGKNLVKAMGLSGAGADLQAATTQLSAALGVDGTRLCKILDIHAEGEVLYVTVSETVCMAGEPQGTDRKCSFTLGAVHGALEELTGRKLKGTHVRSAWWGDPADVFEFKPRI